MKTTKEFRENVALQGVFFASVMLPLYLKVLLDVVEPGLVIICIVKFGVLQVGIRA